MADSTIGSLPAASEITSQDLFVLEQNGEAKKLLGSILEDYLNRDIMNVTVTSVAPTANPTVSYDSSTGALTLGIPRGLGIANIAKTNTSGLVDTYTVTLDKAPSQSVATKFTFTVTNGNAISQIIPISAPHTPGSTDRYAIDMTNGTSVVFEVYNGANGTDGVSIASIEKASGTGAGGTTDVYNVILSTGEIGGTFTVYNGSDGQGAPGSATPLMDGTAAVGTAEGYSREDHRHPTDTSRQATNTYFNASASECSISAGAWTLQSTPAVSGFPYRANIAISGVTSSTYAIVTFRGADVLSGNYAPLCGTHSGGIYIYSKTNVATTLNSIAVFW